MGMKRTQIIHFLPGDAILERFKAAGIEGRALICRECLIEGPLVAERPEDFWSMREAFLGPGESGKSYFDLAASQFEELMNTSGKSEINLWFEYELFCSVNLWFCLSLLFQKGAENVFLVSPSILDEASKWSGFGEMNSSELRECFALRRRLAKSDLQLGAGLWEAYRDQELDMLMELAEKGKEAFPYLKEVCRAEIERKRAGRVESVLEEIIAEGNSGFADAFVEFRKREGAYGFGDTQLKRYFERILDGKMESN